ncbi:HAD family hydrolase [soil metagenome]
MEMTSQKFAFIDRDGTLIEEVNFLSRVEDLRIFPYTATALTMLKDAGFRTVVVTNQSGIGRGIYDEAAMNSIHEKMTAELAGLIDEIHFCPHLPDAGCACRKPNIGMLDRAINGHSLDKRGSWMIGDKLLDVVTGTNAGIRSALVKTGYGAATANLPECRADMIADDLLDAVRRLLAES